MVLQVGTTNFQSTAGESSRNPVNTFVEPVSVLPKTGLMELADTLKSINPTLQKLVNFQIDKAKQEGVLEGQNLLLGADEKQITQIKKELSEKKGNRIMRNFVGGNMYIEYGIEKQLAMNLGNIAEGKTNQFFANYSVQVPNKKGGTTPIPLSQFDVNSKEFQSAINEFKETQLLDTKGIRPQLLNQFFFPQQNAALRKAISKQVEAKADANIQNYSNLITDTSLQYFRNIDKYNENIEENIIDVDFQDGESYALSLLQEDANYTYRLGLSEVVSPTGMVEIIKKNGYRILNDFENGNTSWVEAQSELDDYIDFMSGITVGPSGTNKKGLPVQKTLGEFLDQDDSILELKKDIYKKINDVNKEESDLIEASNKKDISETFKTINYSISPSDPNYTKVLKSNVETYKALLSRHKDLRQHIVKEYNLRNDNIDLWFDRFTRDYNNGKFGSKDKARTRLESFMIALGSTASDEDRTKYDNALKLIEKENAQGVLSSYPEFETTLKNMKEALREDNKSGYTVVKVGYTNAFNDLSKQYRDKIDKWATTTYKNEKEKDEAKAEIIEFVQLQTIKIVEGDYNFENRLLETLYYKANPNLKKTNKKKVNSKIEKMKGLADGGPVKKDVPVIVGEEGKEVFVPKSDGKIISNDVIENSNQEAIKETEQKNIYEVQSGDTLSSIADKFEGVNYLNIAETNGLDTTEKQNNINVGLKLEIPKITIQKSTGEITPLIETKTNLWKGFNGATVYGSGKRKTNLEKDSKYVKSVIDHAYADSSSPEIQQEATKIYSKLFYSNEPEDIKTKNAIVNMVLTEATLNSPEDIAGVVQSVFMRVARSRLNTIDRDRFKENIIEELTRKETNDKGILVPMYQGIEDFTVEQITSNKPVKETQEIYNKIFSMLWEDTSQKDK
jgi:LysM repeat protein